MVAGISSMVKSSQKTGLGMGDRVINDLRISLPADRTIIWVSQICPSAIPLDDHAGDGRRRVYARVK